MLIQCTNLEKTYKKTMIIQNTSVSFRSHSISFLMGPNGVGKTTFIKCLMGMEQYAGTFLFDGKTVDHVRDQCLVIWDDCPFYTNISGLHNLLIFSNMKKHDVIHKAQKYLDRSLLQSKVLTYSYGQKKKLALALIEILQPAYLIMDEISNGLDYEMMRDLQGIIKSWSEHMTIILAGHQFGFYNHVIDDVFIFKKNKIVLYQKDFSKHDTVLEEIYDHTID